MHAIDWAVERNLLAYGPYDQLTITERAWPLCVAVMAALVLLAAYIEHGTVIVP
ncbi:MULTISPECIES: hypothetical protein [unclassified Olsenella]|jgi:hypothetical protein|uniref:hypothetical protein n=1 Tax=unclassified Olsenella TaxID=2638792 RepID=UPI001314B70F|nr:MULTISPECIES: hypothetical protein [unclassified Olsenella]